MIFLSNEELVQASEYIVMARVETIRDTGNTIRWGKMRAKRVKNELQVVELIKGSLPLDKAFSIETIKFDGWMEDNVELPDKGSKVLLFLDKNKNDELNPVNGIQGVWRIKSDGKPIYGTMKEIREIVEKQKISCKSKAFVSLVDRAESQTQAGHHKESLETYKKAYHICPMKDLEEQMAWLMGKVWDDENRSEWR